MKTLFGISKGGARAPCAPPPPESASDDGRSVSEEEEENRHFENPVVDQAVPGNNERDGPPASKKQKGARNRTGEDRKGRDIERHPLRSPCKNATGGCPKRCMDKISRREEILTSYWNLYHIMKENSGCSTSRG